MSGEILSQLPENLRSHEALTGFNTAGDIANAYIETRGKAAETEGKVKDFEGKLTEATTKYGDLEKKLAGAVIKPGENAKPEEIQAYRKAMGVPDKPEEYEFDKAEGQEDSPQLIEWFKGAAHRLGLPKDVAKGLRNEYNSMLTETLKAEAVIQKKARDDARASLVKEAGGEEQYKVVETLADRVWKKVMGQDFGTFVKETGFINNPYPIIKVITMLAKKTGEDFAPGGEPGKGGKDEKGIVYDKSPDPPARPH
jgi:hypothetical protein